eukprot:CAMPEP_0184753852 /NCGR_PEP_ID=MMETSP0315-20130426/44317_1 /TAXON_ID=101924 /ORGANISM="Rhodosorus marinus, Strain UTEX LB 2760" /LENGTH=102 /DNA_ID=CAMNT_0027233243 /DNA_START=154 /DNA_END=462 /DNA_ORIENTATION=+
MKNNSDGRWVFWEVARWFCIQENRGSDQRKRKACIFEANGKWNQAKSGGIRDAQPFGSFGGDDSGWDGATRSLVLNEVSLNKAQVAEMRFARLLRIGFNVAA